jgi:hypothetical protein
MSSAAETSQERRSDILCSRDERMSKVTGMWKKDDVKKKKMSARDRRMLKQKLARERRKKKEYLKTEVLDDLFKETVEIASKLGDADAIPKELVLPSPSILTLSDSNGIRATASTICTATVITCGLLSGHVGSVPFESMGLTMILFAVLRKCLPMIMKERSSSGLMASLRGTGTWAKDMTFFIFSFGLVRCIVYDNQDVNTTQQNDTYLMGLFITIVMMMLTMFFLPRSSSRGSTETELSYVVKALLQHVTLLNACGGGHNSWISVDKIKQHVLSHFFADLLKRYPTSEDRDLLWKRVLVRIASMDGVAINEEKMEICWKGEIEKDTARLKTNASSNGMSQREIRLEKQRAARSK